MPRLLLNPKTHKIENYCKHHLFIDAKDVGFKPPGTYCKICLRERSKKYKDKKYNRKPKDLEEQRAYNAAYRKENKERIAANQKKYKQKVLAEKKIQASTLFLLRGVSLYDPPQSFGVFSSELLAWEYAKTLNIDLDYCHVEKHIVDYPQGEL